MRLTQEEVLEKIYNLILNPNTREWERYLLTTAKDGLEADVSFKDQVAKLEADLRPLALRNNLTPDVTDFYQELTGDESSELKAEKHEIDDPAFQERAIFAGAVSGVWWSLSRHIRASSQYYPGILEERQSIPAMTKSAVATLVMSKRSRLFSTHESSAIKS